jgi:MraZ protein
MRFSGEYYKSLDDKGRISIPREFREVLGRLHENSALVVTKNMDGGLTAYSESEWQEFLLRLEETASGKIRTALNRLYIAPKTEVMIDKQGRIPLSKAQRKWAGLGEDEREVVVVGNFRRIDIFSPARYCKVLGAAVELITTEEELIENLDLP